MRIKNVAHAVVGATMALTCAAPAAAQSAAAGRGWMGEFEHASRQLLQLAEAIPAEKFAWRPAPGVRSTSELYMHVAIGNYYLLGQAGIKPPVDVAALGKEPEKSLTAKAEVIQFVTDSLDAVRAAYPTADRQKAVKFFGNDVTADAVFLRLLAHNHEHMGQAIAYARVNGIAPPWSKAGGQ
jgi:uncharacterized damage-inducible protein DinB